MAGKSPTEELYDKVANGEVLKTWEMEHLFSKLTEVDKTIIAFLAVYLLKARSEGNG